ncbi:MAG: flavodoxin domain-containing protein [Candidatus Bathyarchaeia archaeon]
MTKALVVYGTRYGAAASTSEEIAKVLRESGVDAHVVNAKREKVRSIAEYDLVIVGSGIQINRWTGEPEDFLKKFHKELAKKKVALFVCCGSACPAMADEPDAVVEAKRKYLEEKAVKYNLQPVALGLFGGVYDFNKWPWWVSKRVRAVAMQRLETAGFQEIAPGFYDVRDWDAIRTWTKQLA